MLFYNQIKREFSSSTWRSGQTYFRDERVKNVRLAGNQVRARVQLADGSVCETMLHMARGSITHSSCSCPGHRTVENHCPHVAALCIWIVERGSLLRAGIGSTSDGVCQNFVQKVQKTEAQAKTTPPPKGLKADPVLHVRGIFQGKVFSGVAIEPAARYLDPRTHAEVVEPISHLIKHAEEKIWKTAAGLYLKLTHDIVPILQTINAAKVIYQGPGALENLAKLLASDFRSQMVFHPSVAVELDPEPLKLISLNIGRRLEKNRLLSYEFRNASMTINSEDLSALAREGRLSAQHVWKDNRILRFEVSLAGLSRFANRSGVVTAETKDTFTPDGFAYLDDDAQHPLHPIAAYRLSLELGVETFTVDEDWPEFHEWKRNFEKTKTAPLPRVNYGFDLRDYQKNGLSWLWSLYHRGLAALLADDMGLGKTHQVLAFLSCLYRRRDKVKTPTLVIAPTSVVAAWVQKLEKYDTGLKWYVYHGKGRVLPDADVNLVLTTYGILQKETKLRDKDWHIVVLDEAQAIKNSTTISSRASRVLKSKFRIAMTGTPVENQSSDLWSIMEFLLPGYLGSLPRFKRLYGAGRDLPSEIQARALRRLVSPFLLRRTKSQVLKELPEKTEETMLCDLTPLQARIYQEYLNSSEASRIREDLQGSGRIDYASILALLTRLKQVCDHPKLPSITAGRIKKIKSVNPLDTGKWETFSELLNEALRSNLKVVVFTQYLGMIDLVGHWLASNGVGYAELRGDTLDRSKVLNQFANDPECRVFVCSLLAGGLGIDLTAASVCIHVDRWWNPARENQATDRLHRIGQTRGVQVFKLQIKGTIEDRIAQIIESKRELSGALIEESPVWLKAFSRKELLELLTP